MCIISLIISILQSSLLYVSIALEMMIFFKVSNSLTEIGNISQLNMNLIPKYNLDPLIKPTKRDSHIGQGSQ